MAFLTSFIFSKAGLIGMAIVAVFGTLLFLRADLGIKTHERDQARAELATAKTTLKASEDRRAVEYSLAVKDLGEAETACAARVAQAVKSGSAIRSIVSKPYVLDPKTRCPLRTLVGAGELRHALQPGA